MFQYTPCVSKYSYLTVKLYLAHKSPFIIFYFIIKQVVYAAH